MRSPRYVERAGRRVRRIRPRGRPHRPCGRLPHPPANRFRASCDPCVVSTRSPRAGDGSGSPTASSSTARASPASVAGSTLRAPGPGPRATDRARSRSLRPIVAVRSDRLLRSWFRAVARRGARSSPHGRRRPPAAPGCPGRLPDSGAGRRRGGPATSSALSWPRSSRPSDAARRRPRVRLLSPSRGSSRRRPRLPASLSTRRNPRHVPQRLWRSGRVPRHQPPRLCVGCRAADASVFARQAPGFASAC